MDRFSLQHTLESGQFFRFEKVEELYYCYERDSFLKLKQAGNKLVIEGDQNHALNLLGLTSGYNEMLKFLSQDKKLQPAIEKYRGLRV